MDREEVEKDKNREKEELRLGEKKIWNVIVKRKNIIVWK